MRAAPVASALNRTITIFILKGVADHNQAGLALQRPWSTRQKEVFFIKGRGKRLSRWASLPFSPLDGPITGSVGDGSESSRGDDACGFLGWPRDGSRKTAAEARAISLSIAFSDAQVQTYQIGIHILIT